MKRFAILNLKLAALALLVALPLISRSLSANAQSLPSGDSGGIELTASMDSPAPGQSVTITAQSYSADINSSNITWTSGGKVIAKGLGQNSVTVQAPAIGKRLTVNVTAVTIDGDTLTSSIVIGSGTIDIVFESDGYTPPFFQGKAAVAYQNAVKVVAIPHLANSAGVEYDPKTLVYKWEQNGSVLQDQSGYGKQSVIIPGNIVPRPISLDVTVTSRDGSAAAETIATTDIGAPSLVFYRNDPLYGPLFNNAVGNSLYLGSSRETGVLAVPFGFNASQGAGLAYTWLINGVSHPELASNRSITLRAPDEQGGRSNIELTINNPAQILQQADVGFSTIWTATNNSASAATF